MLLSAVRKPGVRRLFCRPLSYSGEQKEKERSNTL